MSLPSPELDRLLTKADSLELLLPAGAVPLGFAPEGARVYLAGIERGARWPSEVMRRGRASLRVGGRALEGAATLVTDAEERTRALDLFRIRYGPEKYARWYARAARVLSVDLEARGPATKEVYHRWLESEFDDVAEAYDRHITGNRMNRLLRDRSLARLRATFAGKGRLLEIGCGSGMETLPLLRDGHEIACLDISSKMLDVVRRKARAEGLSERLETVHAPAAELSRFEDAWRRAFDGVYSTYGALNCEPALGRVPAQVHGVLRPGGAFVAGIYNRWCVFELLGYGITGRWRRAVGRRGRPIEVGASRFCVDVFSVAPPEFASMCDPYFRTESLEGVPVLLPPSDLVSYAERFSTDFDRLARWDRWLGQRWPFRALGDHFLVTLRRRDVVGPVPAGANSVPGLAPTRSP